MRWRHLTTPSFVPLSLPTSCSPSLSLLRLLPLWVTWQPWNRCTSPDRVQVAWPAFQWGLAVTFTVSCVDSNKLYWHELKDTICRAQPVYSEGANQSLPKYCTIQENGKRNITIQLNKITSGFEEKMLGTSKSILSADLSAPAGAWTWGSLVRYHDVRPFQSLQALKSWSSCRETRTLVVILLDTCQ